jgi:hypothetical protein
LEVAHTIIAVSAFFEALDDIDLPFDLRQLALTAEERRHITRIDLAVLSLAESQAPIPAPHLDHQRFLVDLGLWYASTGGTLLEFAQGLAVRDALDDTRRTIAREAISTALPGAACRRYEDMRRRLATEIQPPRGPAHSCTPGTPRPTYRLK